MPSVPTNPLSQATRFAAYHFSQGEDRFTVDRLVAKRFGSLSGTDRLTALSAGEAGSALGTEPTKVEEHGIISADAIPSVFVSDPFPSGTSLEVSASILLGPVGKKKDRRIDIHSVFSVQGDDDFDLSEWLQNFIEQLELSTSGDQNTLGLLIQFGIEALVEIEWILGWLNVTDQPVSGFRRGMRQ